MEEKYRTGNPSSRPEFRGTGARDRGRVVRQGAFFRQRSVPCAGDIIPITKSSQGEIVLKSECPTGRRRDASPKLASLSPVEEGIGNSAPSHPASLRLSSASVSSARPEGLVAGDQAVDRVVEGPVRLAVAGQLAGEVGRQGLPGQLEGVAEVPLGERRARRKSSERDPPERATWTQILSLRIPPWSANRRASRASSGSPAFQSSIPSS